MQKAWLLAALLSCAFAQEDAEVKKSKLPYVADAVGNRIPPPSSGPATVGSPSNLLTPDRYEFYTFDESGELVKRLMTLEEIQAIVAAGEGADGHLVTFSNDEQPPMTFNFSQPPSTKVNSVLTNVQNVLQAHIDAQKNNPPSHAPLDTPDVSDSWSLILPSIFGNKGVDIVPDKTSTFTTPDTETIELDRPMQQDSIIYDNTLSKEGNNKIPVSISTTMVTPNKYNDSEASKNVPLVIEKLSTLSETSTIQTRTTITPVTTTTTFKPHSTTKKETIRTTTVSPSFTTPKLKITTKKLSTIPVLDKQKHDENNFIKIDLSSITKSNESLLTENFSSVKYESTTTSAPIRTSSTVHGSGKFTSTQKPVVSSKPLLVSSTTKWFATTTLPPKTSTYLSTKSDDNLISVQIFNPSSPFPSFSTNNNDHSNRDANATTLTTQSVSPSTTVSTTEFMQAEKNTFSKIPTEETTAASDSPVNDKIDSDSEIPLFDVAQSISQIASDLGNNFPIPTTSDLLQSMKDSNLELESKENVDIEIPETNNTNDVKTTTNTVNNEFIKISTIDPHLEPQKVQTLNNNANNLDNTMIGIESSVSSTTIDPILSESMEDVLSQVVHQSPQSIIQSTEKKTDTAVANTTSSLTNVTLETRIQSEDSASELITTENLNSSNETNSQLNVNSATIDNLLHKNNIYKNNTKQINGTEIRKTQVNENYVKIQSVTTDKTTLIEETSPYKITENRKNTTNPEYTSKNNSMSNSTTKEKNITVSKNVYQIDKPNLTENNTLENSHLEIIANQTDSKSKLDKETAVSANITSIHATDEKNKSRNSSPLKPGNMNVEGTESQNNILEKTISQVEELKKKIQKVNIDDKELVGNLKNNTWKLISTVSPPKANEIPKDKVKHENNYVAESNDLSKEIILDVSKENQGLEVTTKGLDNDVSKFTELCNELAFRYWNAAVENIDKRRSFVLSPYSITSMLAMMFMGARGSTSGEMNDILKLDDMVTFNPHYTLKNISDSIIASTDSGIIVSAFIRELYSDRNKGRILTFYKERAHQFYSGHVEEINFKLINDIIRRRTNLLVKRYTWGRILEYIKSNSITMNPPLAAFSANIFQTDCSGSSVEGRDGEMYFVVSPNVRQRRLVPVPAVVYKRGFLAGYDPVLDATAAALGTTNSIVSTLFLMPGQQGNVVHAEDLEALERRLLDSNPTMPAWNRLLRTLLPRIGLELQIPRFSHKSIFNVSSTLMRMGLKDLFDPDHADLGGLNGPSKDLYLSDMIQSSTIVTCGEGVISEQHHVEEYPESVEVSRRRRTSRWTGGWDEPRDYQRAFHDPHDVGDAMHLPLHLRPRQARLPARNSQPARLKFDRPFLFFVRHNPTGMLLYVGRYNPRLLP